MHYKVIFIDWDGTLSSSRFWGRWNESPKHSSKYNLLQDVLFTSDEGKILLKDWMTGVKSYSNIIDYASNITNIPYGDLEEELRYSAENMKFIDKNTLGLIEKLKACGIKVVIATDNMDTFSKWTVPAMKLESRFDDILVSDTLNAMKTHISPEGVSLFFNDYLSRQGIEANQSVLIDDNLNTKTVEQCGINFLHVNKAESLTLHLKRILEKVH